MHKKRRKISIEQRTLSKIRKLCDRLVEMHLLSESTSGALDLHVQQSLLQQHCRQHPSFLAAPIEKANLEEGSARKRKYETHRVVAASQSRPAVELSPQPVGKRA